MIVKNWTRWTTLLLISTLTISGCSLIPNKKIDIVSKPLEIDIIQPTILREWVLKSFRPMVYFFKFVHLNIIIKSQLELLLLILLN